MKVHDIFMHDTKRSYGRFVTGIFYVGPIAYKTAKDEDAVGEAFLILNLYDARRNGFWTILDKITGRKLG